MASPPPLGSESPVSEEGQVRFSSASRGSSSAPFRFRDTVYRNIYLSPLSSAVIHTDQFQRLKHIHQLGTAHFCFPTATHTRFEHCIGVAYLTRRFMQHIRHSQLELELTDHHVQMVEVAGLCHDLGHGPFSHTYEVAQWKADPRNNESHEDRSIALTREILGSLQDPPSEDFIDAVCYMIDPKPSMEHVPPIIQQKPYLAEIVANKHHGIDTDKLDYLLRDTHHVMQEFAHCRSKEPQQFKTIHKTRFNIQNIINGTVVKNNRIMYRDTCKNDICNVSLLRLRMHESIYADKKVFVYDYLMSQMMSHAIKDGSVTASLTDSEVYKTINACPSARRIMAVASTYHWKEDVHSLPENLPDGKIVLEWGIYESKQTPWKVLPTIPFVDAKGKIKTFAEKHWNIGWRPKRNRKIWRVYAIETK
jgi:deoxynucleoside triphosphate triphosphohydrolase SAMHD1